ncbi:hypothetical protein Plec18167_006846 [Paecilomyces lecythidis]|uniref:Uncharacterized protein n=1 Tax=Paecilomyces lecythidis TaxID=3004212 RepID=A0ABR3X8J8_9EURO
MMAGAELFIVLDLGSSTFRLRHSGLSLTSYVFAKLIVPDNCAHLLHSERLEEMLKSGACWVTSAPELVLHAHVQGNGDSHTSSYLELVSEILQDEKV